MTKQMTVYMDDKTYKDFSKEAKKLDRSLNWLFNQCVGGYLDKDERKKLLKDISDYEHLFKRVSKNLDIEKIKELKDESLNELLEEHKQWANRTEDYERFTKTMYSDFVKENGRILDYENYLNRIKPTRE